MEERGEVRRGAVYLADLGEYEGSVQGGTRPVVVLQNDVGNKFSPTTLVCPLTSKTKKELPTHVTLPTSVGLQKESVALCEQIRVIDKSKLKKLVCRVSDDRLITQMNKGLMISLGLTE